MRLPEVTKDELLRAIDTFDRGYRHLPEWADWTANRTHKFAIVDNDRLYPSKMIVALATGVDRDKFSGGMQPGQAGWYAERAGLDVIELRTRNPNWSREELIVALDFYLAHRSRIPNKTSAQIKTLSGIIGSIAHAQGLSGGEDFRNVNGVYMKLMNFKSLDQAYIESGLSGLQSVGRADREVWNEFSSTHFSSRVSHDSRSG